MRNLMTKLGIAFSVLLYLMSCNGNEHGNEIINDIVINSEIVPNQTNENKNDSVISPISNKKNDTTVIKSVDPIDIVEGTYYLQRTNDDNENIDKKIVVRILNKNIISLNNKETYDFKKTKKGEKTILEFGNVSEESGDWYGGGRIEIFKGKPTLIILTGSEANFKSIYHKR